MNILGIETSCDETAIAVVNDKKQVVSHVLASQIEAHSKYGGVVPELASRNHLDAIMHLYKQATENFNPEDIDGIAVTAGPGLIGGLLVGVMFAKGLALGLNKPIIAVNHLEGHALTARFTSEVEFPYLMLLVSGGHCQILEVLGVGNYVMLGKTRDDSVGEAFDKVAKMLGLGYPGGPIIEKLAKIGNENVVKLPVPILRDTPFDFSFSGLKSAVRRHIETEPASTEDICATFQRVAADVLCDRVLNAAKHFAKNYPNSRTVVVAGGVAANQYISARLQNALAEIEFMKGFNVVAPPIKLCTDNGIMIAWAGLERFRLGLIDNLEFEPRSRWPLEQLKESFND
ncbi:MAG: tRNA (adenosine(37)-N6)-threonylcarbamoyltransferase complex transferase subunit TsaD [Candidatus Jidaibacter sp.]|jgi:N6-L-threonylcarbamoyladenine synthase|nr:tRNA (adenosine(37)-N6)-threonylcarbamoyltransferase complex transferase subunit TsaD [Candidatus Jidaibacter sp.]